VKKLVILKDISVAVFCLSLVFSNIQCSAAAEKEWEPIMPSVEKGIPLGFQKGSMMEPNVLLLIDTSGSMTFENDSDNSTYGDGTRPGFLYSSREWVWDRWPWSGHYEYRNHYGRYFGRDTDSSNNDPSDPDDYHPMLRYIDATSGDLPDYAYTSTNEVLDEMATNQKDAYFAKLDGRYLFPNDSRLYKLKLVLWRILQDPSLVSNLRMSLATYYQHAASSNEYGDWYVWTPDSDGWGSKQRISWKGGNRDYALQREPFASTSDAGHLDRLRMWVDGAEYSDLSGYDDNPELRADGHTPLASSIYNVDWWGNHTNDAYSFFAADDVVQGWCQDNYLIVLTDGKDTAGGNPVSSVENLYNNSKNIAYPPYFGRDNQPVRTLVIGFIDPDRNPDLRNTLNRMADVGWDGQEDHNGPRGDGIVDQAYFANDVDSLLAAFSDIFSIIQHKSGSGGAPLVSPGSKSGGEDATAYVASFYPDMDGQWEGHLKKYPISADGTVGDDPEWDAGKKLDDRLYSSREVYTVNWKNSIRNMVDFTDDNVADLRSLMVDNPNIEVVADPSFTDSDWQSFIRWTLGSNEYGADTRWKLADMYHSGLTEVGRPMGGSTFKLYRQFLANNRNRDAIVYVQGNDGMLHAFNAETDVDKGITGGVERWAFLPPNVLDSGRLIGLRGTFSKTSGQAWQFNPKGASERESIPRYLLDGPIIAEDIYDSDAYKWRTILMGLLGYAGAGMYCMDITDPDSPEFMWAVENAYLKPNGEGVLSKNKNIVHWYLKPDDSVSCDYHGYTNYLDLPPDMDYSSLRFALSVPAIGSMTLEDSDGDSVTKWVALMGNGSDMGVDNVNEGYVYAIDILNGDIVNKFKFSNDMKMIVTPVTVLRTNSSQNIETFYVGDNDGNVYEADESDGWEGREVIGLQGSNGPSYRMEVGRLQGRPWLFIVTGDNPDDSVVSGSATNYAVAVNTKYSSDTLQLSDLTEIDPDSSGSVSSSQAGWYFSFEADEYPTTPALLYSGYIFFATFDKDADPCEIGTSRIYIVNARTGAGAWTDSEGNKKKYVELPGVQVSGITVSDNMAYIGVIDHSGTGTSGLPSEFGGLNASMENNLLTFEVPQDVKDSASSMIERGQMLPKYWREWLRK